MKLIVAHQILIASAIGLAAIFALRSVVRFARGGGTVEIAIAAAASVVGALLFVYLRSVRAKWLEKNGRTGS